MTAFVHKLFRKVNNFWRKSFAKS